MNERRVLESWKAIAGHLGRTEKTCRKWERELRLPIHRLDDSAKAHVFAYEDEIDRWKAEKLQAKKVRKSGRLSGLFGLFSISRQTKFWLIAVTSLLILVLAGFLIRQAMLRGNSASSEPVVYDSIAILPLINDSGDPSQDYFANSMTDLLISDLWKVAALDVSPRGSVMRYKNSDKSYKEIAAELNVEALVEASVFKSGNRVRLTVRLIDPYRNDKIIWADTFEREYSEIMILQSILSLSIINGIKVKITPEEKARLAVDRRVIPKAYDLFLRGIQRYISPGRGESFLKIRQDAVDYFQKAIDIDPGLAIAHAWTAHILVQLAIEGLVDEKEVLPKAKDAAVKALALDDNLAEAHRSLSLIKICEWDFSGAEREIRLALELKPKEWLARILFPRFLNIGGKTEEAVAFLKHEIEQDEKQYSKRRYWEEWGLSFLFLGLYQEGLEEFKNVASSFSAPNWAISMWLAVAYALNGKNSEALQEINKVKDLPAARADAVFLRQHAGILGRCGRREEALRKIEELMALPGQKNVDHSMSLAGLYAVLGDNDKAFEYLDRAYKTHSSQLSRLLNDHWLHNLHSDPRFDALREKMGLPRARRLE
jgi:TolB-like protein/Flp pilus assembly protein TadD